MNTTPALGIPEAVLRELLECCPKEAPFTCPRGNKFRQIDEAAMGSPLLFYWPTFLWGRKTSSRKQKHWMPTADTDDISIKTKNQADTDRPRHRLQQPLALTSPRKIAFTDPCLSLTSSWSRRTSHSTQKSTSKLRTPDIASTVKVNAHSNIKTLA